MNFKWALWKGERDGQIFERGSEVPSLFTGQKGRDTGRDSRLKWDEGIPVEKKKMHEKKKEWDQEQRKRLNLDRRITAAASEAELKEIWLRDTA